MILDFSCDDIEINPMYEVDLGAIENRLRVALKPPPNYKISEWADNNRILSTSTSAHSGKWQTSRVPYMKFIMDAITDPYTEQVTLVMCSQVGKTELLNNIMGYYIDNDPCPMMFIMPTKDLAEEYSKRSFASMMRESPCFHDKIQIDKKSSTNNIDYKEFKGGLVLFVGSQKANALASVPIRIVLADEIDRFSLDADGEGNPINLAKKRTSNFPNRKWILCSTPTVHEKSQIIQEYAASSKYRYYCKCPFCEGMQYLKWVNVNWVDDDPDTAKYVCEHCGVLWEDLDRYKAIDNGVWIAENPNIKRNIGFHLPRMASGFCRLSDVVKEYVDAKGDPKKLKVFVNTVLAETTRESADETSPNFIMDRAEGFDSDNIPDEVMILTAGADIQNDRIECMIAGWGRGHQAWVLENVVLTGDPLQDEVWVKLDNLLKREYRSNFYKQSFQVRYAAVDSGHLPQRVYEYCYKTNTLDDCKMFATKGQESISRGGHPLFNKQQILNSHTVREASKPFMVGTYEAKSWLHEYLNYSTPQKGYWHFPKKFPIEFYEQLTSEKRYLEFKDGKERYKWLKPNSSTRNEALDTAVLNLWLIHVANIDFDHYHEWLENKRIKTKLQPIKFKKF
jgi:phage terminase large subunit GpA-like protein